MRVLDLFSGLGGWSNAFRERGHEVITLDIERRFKPDLEADVHFVRGKNLLKWGPIDVMLASPPCNGFSVAGIPHHWKAHIPDQHVSEGLSLVANTFRLIAEVKPRYWVLENPRAMLRHFLGASIKETIFMCSYGAKWKKPTDLWGEYPGTLFKPCTPHQKAPRGADKGVQGAVRDPALRAEIPHGLSLELCQRIENQFLREKPNHV